MQSAPRASRRSTLTLTVAPGIKTKYGDLRKEARSIMFKNLGITELRCRRAVTGGFVQEVSGKEIGAWADALVSKLNDVFQGKEEFHVAHPVESAEIRLYRLVG